MVTKEQLGQKVSNPAEFFDEIDAQLQDGESPTVNLVMDAPPRYVLSCRIVHGLDTYLRTT